MNLRTMGPSEYLFIRWLSENHPGLLSAAEARMKKGGQLGALSDSLNSILDAVNKGLSTYVQGKQSLALVKLNVQRAKQGLPPMTEGGGEFQVPKPEMHARNLPGGIPDVAWIGLGLALLYFVLRD